MRNIGRFVGCWLVVAALQATHGMAAAAAPTNALSSLDHTFQTHYSRMKNDLLVSLGPMIEVYEGDKLVLVQREHRTEASFTSPTDDNLKTIAHVPLGVFAMLKRIGSRPMDDESLSDVRSYRDQVSVARAVLAGAGLTAVIRVRQEKILDDTQALLGVALERRGATADELETFARRMAPLMLENVTDVARHQLDAIHAQVTRWRSDLGPEDWSRLRVVVMGIHMARDGELATQYFMRVLHEPVEGRRVVYAEGLWDEASALGLLATHIIDGNIGSVFFGDDLRMHRDVFADAARSYLDCLAVGQ